MEVAKRSLIGRKRKRACAVGLFTHFFGICSSVSPAVFVFDSSKNCTMVSKEAYLATELDRAKECNIEDSNLAAVIEDYFELSPLFESVIKWFCKIVVHFAPRRRSVRQAVASQHPL